MYFLLAFLPISLMNISSQTDKTKPTIVKSLSVEKKVTIEDFRLEKWESLLKVISKREDISLFVEIPTVLDAPNFSYGKKSGEATMNLLSTCISRHWEVVNDIQVFFRYDKDGNSMNSTNRRIKTWLTNLDNDQKDALVSGTLDISSLPESSQRLLINTLMSETGAFPTELMRQTDAVANRGIGCSISPVPMISWKDVKTGEIKTLPLPNSTVSPKIPNSIPSILSNRRLGKPVDGDIDFGDGKIISLLDLMTIMKEKFGISVIADDRIIKTNVFISGKNNFKSLRNIVDRVTTLPKAKFIEKNIDDDLSVMVNESFSSLFKGNFDVTASRDSLRFDNDNDKKAFEQRHGKSESIDSTYFKKNTTTTISELCNKAPGLAQYLKSAGVNSDLVQCRMGFQLNIQAAGKHIVGSAQMGNKEIPILTDNKSQRLIR